MYVYTGMKISLGATPSLHTKLVAITKPSNQQPFLEQQVPESGISENSAPVTLFVTWLHAGWLQWGKFQGPSRLPWIPNLRGRLSLDRERGDWKKWSGGNTSVNTSRTITVIPKWTIREGQRRRLKNTRLGTEEESQWPKLTMRHVW